MTIFAVVGVTDTTKLKETLDKVFPDNYIAIPAASGFFVAVSPKIAVTAKDVSDKLSITDGTIGSGIILNIAGYYGRSNPQIWEWIAAKTRQVE